MALSYTEEIVSEYFKFMRSGKRPKYFVTEHLQFKARQCEKKVSGWRDIDVLAMNEKEIVIIQTKSYALCSNTKKQSLIDIADFFVEAVNAVKQTTRIKKRNIIKLFIADFGLSKPMRSELKKRGIVSMSIKEVLLDFVQQIYDNIDESTIGKFENNVTRTLIALITNFNLNGKSLATL